MKKQLPLFYKELFPRIAEALDNIFILGKPADKAIEQIMRLNKKWPYEKRNFFAEAIYGFVRYRRLFQEVAESYFNTSDITYQELIICWSIYNEYELPAAGVYKNINTPLIRGVIDKLSAVRKIRESIPDWLDQLGEKELGVEWEPLIASLNKKPPLTIRTNTLKISAQELKEELKKENIKAVNIDWCSDALEIEGYVNLFRTEALKKGFFEIQDTASQFVAKSMDVKPGMRIIDACAGAGGKTMHIASLMNNKGKVIALDTKEWRLNELKKRARRAGTHIIETKILDSGKVIKRLANSADRLLLDVPCTGLGVLKRNPDIKWKLTPQRLEEIKKEQQYILSYYSQMLKQDGKMIYATCSILPEEGEEQVKKFLGEKKSEWELIGENRLSPLKNNCDGFYIAVLQRAKKSNIF